MAMNGTLDRAEDFLGSLHLSLASVSKVKVPVAIYLQLAALGGERVGRKELAQTLEGGLPERDEAERQEGVKGRYVQVRRAAPIGQDGLDLGAENDLICIVRNKVIEGFDPESVTGQEETPCDPIPYCEGKHPIQPLDARFAPRGVRAQNHFRVR